MLPNLGTTGSQLEELMALLPDFATRTVNSCLHNTLREQEAEKLATEGLTFAKQEPL